MRTWRTPLAIMAASAVLLPAATILGAAVLPVGAAQSCATSKVAVTHLVKVTEKVREHGKLVTKTVKKREDVRVKERVKETVRVKVDGKWKTKTKLVTKLVVKYRSVTTCTPIATTTTAVVTTTSAPMTTSAPVSVSGSVDPSYILDTSTPQPPPVEVTFTYSASAGATTLPNGTLTLTIYTHGAVASAGGCVANVTAATATQSCEVAIPAWGKYDADVSYSTNSPNVTPTAATETFDIEPPALVPTTIAEKWGTDAPTNGFAINSYHSLGATFATVVLTDATFEGATSVTFTDQYGTCTAPVSGTTAQCDITENFDPFEVTIGYPGGPDTQTGPQTVSPWGIPQSQVITDTWPAVSVQTTPGQG